ncbi:MAG TPA: octanoyltransferase [Chloroflexi bacterium]|nr:octanoyltransferase [Chloroflexota bacterium]HHW86082.1 lipoate--protein ligase family protein [Chloroflexota bacterium]
MERTIVANDVFVDVAALEEEGSTTWRLIVEEAPRSGAANMAVDQAIAEACAAGESLPTVRFYRWQPPAVSLGRLQPIADIDTIKVSSLGYEIVRRPTGGRAILHTDEFTYSVTAAMQHPLVRGGVMDAYLRISNALLAGLRQLGVHAEKAPGDVRVGADVSAVCFEVPSAYEITVGQRKLMGSAQSRRAGYVLQHGSLPLVGDITRLIDVLALPAEQAASLRRELAARACTLAQALGVDDASDKVAFGRVAAAMQHGFEQVLRVSFQPGALTPAELRRAAELIRTQFGNDEWNRQR